MKMLISIALAVLLALIVGLFWTYGGVLFSALTGLVSPEPAHLAWWKLLLTAAVAAAAGLVTERYALKRYFPRILAFAGVWFVAGTLAAYYLGADLAVLPVVSAAVLAPLLVHFKKLWEIDRELTEKLVSLASTGHLLEGRSADLRIESGFKLLETFFPVSEIIVFRLDRRHELIPVGRARKDRTDNCLLSRQTSWLRCVELCEAAIASRETQISREPENRDAARVALPLVCDDLVVGVLFVDIKQNFERNDQNLLESFSRQLARSFQRLELSRKPLPHNAWRHSFSTQSLENRLDIINLVHGIIMEQSFSAIAGSYLHEAHAIAYLDGTLAYLNRRMKHLADLRSEEIPELDLFKLLGRFRTDVFNEPGLAIRRVMQTGDSFECELKLPDQKKTLGLQITLVKTPLRYDTIHDTNVQTVPACFLVTFRDISAVKENEKLRSDMVNLMSHELRTPITSITGFADMVLLEDGLSDDARQFLRTIANESRRAGQILTNFLSVANLQESDKQEVIKTPVEVNEVVREVVEDLQKRAKEKRIRLVDRRGKDIPPISADKGLLTKALSHLLDNAIRYSPERSSVMISTILENDFLRVDVEDRGYGIPKSEQDKIWQKFYRVAREGHDKQDETTGLGLSLVKEIIERHQGEVSVLSVEGRGSRFTFRLPRL